MLVFIQNTHRSDNWSILGGGVLGSVNWGAKSELSEAVLAIPPDKLLNRKIAADTPKMAMGERMISMADRNVSTLKKLIKKRGTLPLPHPPPSSGRS